MKGKIPLMIAASALFLVCAAGAQQTPPPKTEPAKPKKVWTNEDVSNLRKPSDDYEDAKRRQAEEAANAKKKADAEKAAPQSSANKPKDFLPKTVEEAEKLVAAKQYEIGQQYEAIDLVKQEQAKATTDEARQGYQKRIDSLTATLDESVAEMRAVDSRLKELKANPPAPSQPAAVSASPAIAELEKQIAQKQEKIDLYNEQIPQLRDAIAKTDSEPTRASLQKKLDGFTALLDKDSAELKTLQSRLQELKAKPPTPPKPETPKP